MAEHYGDPMAEQKALVAGTGVVDLSTRGVLTVAGPDRLSWLDTLSTQWLRDLAPGMSVSAEALILSPHGHIEHALHLVDDGQTSWITVEPGTADALRAHLESMRFMLRVEIADVSSQWAVLGRMSDEPAGDADGPVWRDPWPGPVGQTATYSDADPHPGAGWNLVEQLVARDRVAGLLAAAVPAGHWALRALRIAAWRPQLGAETDHRTIPHELDWLRTAVHLRKGCYRGQETVARVHNLGRPPRRLVMLHLDGSEHTLPEPQSALTLPGGGRSVGRITSVAWHYEQGPIALAVVKRSLPAETVLHAGSISAAQQIIVG
ncbi:MAG: folate-binding protein YgfZ [Micrococcales bacterium]|nr:MAG: folate-binding protein YgfZ [Micrococcales bacterium]